MADPNVIDDDTHTKETFHGIQSPCNFNWVLLLEVDLDVAFRSVLSPVSWKITALVWVRSLFESS